MSTNPSAEDHRAEFDRLNAVRTELLEKFRVVRELAGVRRDLIQKLIDIGFTKSDIAREMGVSRQAIQKMLAA